MTSGAKPTISVVTAAYRSAPSLAEFMERVVRAVQPVADDFEVIVVDDCGGDDSWAVWCELARSDTRLKGVRLSRNFGQHYALTAGLEVARMEWVVVLDCDLQDRPEDIPRLLATAVERRLDIVLARRSGSRERPVTRLLSKAFYKVYDYLDETRTDETVGTYRILSARVVRAYLSLPERNRFFGSMILWLGFDVGYLDTERAPRAHGRSGYTFRRKLDLAIDGITSFSQRPLRVSVKLGMALCALSVAYGLVLVYQRLVMGHGVPGWASILVSLYFLSGVILFNMGIMGIYVGKIFVETKRRPLFLVRDVVNLAEAPR